MRSRPAIVIVALLAMVAGLRAQQSTTTKQAGTAASVVTEQLTGEVVWTQGNLLVAKMQPTGYYRVFMVAPGRQFMIDGQAKLIADVKIGTVLTASVITTTQPVTVRTTSVLNGSVVWVAGNYVILALPSGDNKGYTVPESFKFVVDGKEASVHDLKVGMKVSATKIVEDPQTEISTKTVITGKAPK
jgi:hypothetical protein